MTEFKTRRFLFSTLFPVLFVSYLGGAGRISANLSSVLQYGAASESVSVIITLSDQVDVGRIQKTDKESRRAEIKKQLKEKASQTQGPLKRFLESQGSKRIVPLWIINAIAAELPAGQVTGLAAYPGVTSVDLDYRVQASAVSGTALAAPEWNLNAIRVPDLWGVGLTGAGTVVANLDTGVDVSHPDLAARYRGGPNGWFNPYSDPANAIHCRFANNCSPCELSSSTPCDVNGHGTQTMGVMVGGSVGGTAIGVAPDAKWIAVKALDDGKAGPSSIILLSFQWILDLPPDEAPDVVNNSWGFPLLNQCVTTFFSAIETLKLAGIQVVFAAGNSGPAGYTSVSPANNLGVMAIGATDATDTIASFSSRGPSACDASYFPQLVAPGVNIRAAVPTDGGTVLDPYANVLGTSFAAPHVAGAMALLLCAFPDLTVAEVETILRNTTSPGLGAPLPNNSYGYGLIDVVSAYQAAFLAEKGSIPEIAVFPTSGDFGYIPVAASTSLTFTVVNRGVADLSIEGATLEGASAFSIQSDTCSATVVNPNASCTVTVEFSPNVVGTQSDVLSIESSDPTNPLVEVPLRGGWSQLDSGKAIASTPGVAWNSTAGQFQIAFPAADGKIWVGTAQANGTFNDDWVQLPRGWTRVAPAILWNPTASKVQLAHKGFATNNIFLGTYNPDGTGLSSSWTLIPANSLSAPAVAWNDATDRLQLGIRGTDNWLAVSTVNGDGTDFSGWTQLDKGRTSAAPAIALEPVTNRVLIEHKGNLTNNLFLLSVNADLTEPSAVIQLRGATSAAPAVLWNEATNALLSVHKGNLTNKIFVGTADADGTDQSPWTEVPGALTTDAPAIAINPTNGTLHIFSRDPSGNLVQYVTGY